MKEILFVGNPNVGKTTLFNTLTSSNAKTGNFHGVTVDEKVKKVNFYGKEFECVDLPGIYSMTPNSYEEEVSINYILSHKDASIVVVSQSNALQKNLLILYELCELERDVILFVNKMPKGGVFDIKKLENNLGIKLIFANAKNKNEVEILKESIFKDEFKSNKINIKICPNLLYLKNKISKNNLSQNLQNFFIYKAFSGSKYYQKKLNIKENDFCFNDENDNFLQNNLLEKYNYISSILQKSNYVQKRIVGQSKLDKIFLNKFLCLPIFLLIMIGVFYLTFFSLGAFLSNCLRFLFVEKLGWLCVQSLKNCCQLTWLVDLVDVGIFGGVGTIISFLPQVVLLFLALDILEQSGYISRLAFMLDDTLKKVGLSGKSVYTLLMGFGCGTSACMTARTMSDKNAKIKTAMLAPFMSCSAKLPVYAVIGGAFFGANNIWIIVCLYILGIVVALLLSLFFESTTLKSNNQTFIMEFPDYQKVGIKHIFTTILSTIKTFLIRIGSLLLVLSIIVWILENFSFDLSYVKFSSKSSMIETLGKIISPIFVPLGFSSWGITSALLAGVVAKEIIISSIAIFNNVSSNNSNFMQSVSNSLKLSTSVVYFTPASALSFMVFCLLYTPCVSTMAVLGKEIGKKWTIICILMQFVIAYITAMITFGLFNLIAYLGIVNSLFLILLIICIVHILRKLLNKKKSKIVNAKCMGCNRCK